MHSGSIIKARVICTCASTQQIFLSMTRTTESLSYQPDPVDIGVVHEDGAVVSVDGVLGMMLAPNVYIPLVRLADNKPSSVEGLYHVGQKKVAYRVLSYNLIDDLVIVGREESIINHSSFIINMI